MRVLGAFTLAALAFALSACQSTQSAPTVEQVAAAEKAANQVTLDVPLNYKTLIAEYLMRTLKDPYSIRDPGISDPKRAFVGLLNGGTGSVVCVQYNAKNSFGAYIGLRPVAFVFRAGMLVTAITEDPLACASAIYAPFPEIDSSPGAPSSIAVSTVASPVKLGVYTSTVELARRSGRVFPPGGGVLIMSVDPVSVAQQAGVRAGDILVSFNGVALRDTPDLDRALMTTQPGTRAQIEVVRGSSRLTLAAVFPAK